MLLSSLIFTIAAFAGSIAKKSTIKTAPSQFCENYAVCLESLEVKQRECLSSEGVDLSGGRSERTIDLQTNKTTECTHRKRKDLQHELAELHLRRTEIIRDCISKNSRRGRSILNPQKERKCLANAEKLMTFTEMSKNEKADGKKSRRSGGKTENAKIKRKKQQELKTSSNPTQSETSHTTNLPIITTSNTATKLGENSNLAMRQRAKRRATLAGNKKNTAKICKRAKKSVVRKCHQISKCCSIVNECQLLADAIDSQIVELKMEFKAPACQN